MVVVKIVLRRADDSADGCGSFKKVIVKTQFRTCTFHQNEVTVMENLAPEADVLRSFRLVFQLFVKSADLRV